MEEITVEKFVENARCSQPEIHLLEFDLADRPSLGKRRFISTRTFQ